MTVQENRKNLVKKGPYAQLEEGTTRRGRVIRWAFFVLLLSAGIFVFLQKPFLEKGGSVGAEPRSDADGSAQKGAHGSNAAVVAAAGEGIELHNGREAVRASSARSIGEEEFSAITQSARSKDVVLRNTALNQLQMLARNPENLGTLRSELLKLDATDEVFAPLVAALGAVGSPAVQVLLRDLVQQRDSDWRTFSAVVPVMGLLSEPTNETIEFLAEKTRSSDRDFSSTAALALGSTVHALSKTDVRRGEALLHGYIERLNDPQSSLDELKEGMAVVGNAGLPGTADVLMKLANHPRADVRADAVMALRFIRTTQVEVFLLQRLQADSDVEVRMRAVDALVHGPIPLDSFEVAKTILARLNSVPAQLREKLLDLFLHGELQADEKRQFAQWLGEYLRRENDSSVQRKGAVVIQELLRVR